MRSHRCRKNATHEHLGEWYCKTHHPPTVNERKKAREDERQKELAARGERWAQQAAQKAEQERRAALYPELLEALRLFVDDAHTLTERERLEKARAVIAKATGVKPCA